MVKLVEYDGQCKSGMDQEVQLRKGGGRKWTFGDQLGHPLT